MSPVDALQRALAAEHAATYVYGAIGAATSVSATPGLFASVAAAYGEHRARRDLLTARLRDRGAEPVAADAAYAVPEPLRSPADVSAAALAVERACEETYAWVVEQTSREDRQLAVTALTSAAVRALAFRGSPEIFPGIGEHADR
ncbi:ferritin-like domain-containing protein [Nocardioides aestuarii]|uniref:Ferritin-like domain-containing protein n=1 Tax=Nocardioides aestuarii TaxID=252231 RepID=A0ABW4TJ86_9ACTN